MKSRIGQWVSWIGVIEVAMALFPIAFSVLFVITIFKLQSTMWLITLLLILFYIMVAKLRSAYYKRKSSKLGMKYYYAIPTHPRILKMMLRGRLDIQAQNGYTLHVNAKLQRKNGNLRTSLRNILYDIQFLNDKEIWGLNSVFVGNTYADLGMKQIDRIKKFGEIEMIKGTFLPLQTWFQSKRLIMLEQKKLYNRVFYNPQTEIIWKIYKITPY